MTAGSVLIRPRSRFIEERVRSGSSVLGRDECIGDTRAFFLATIEAGDLPSAKALIAPNFAMVFPGNKRHDSMVALLASSNSLYRKVGEFIEGINAVDGRGKIIVYSYGTPDGEWLDGREFDGIRFVVLSEIADGKSVAQEVWNDSGEARASREAQL
jgi:hypothetical protein